MHIPVVFCVCSLFYNNEYSAVHPYLKISIVELQSAICFKNYMAVSSNSNL